MSSGRMAGRAAGLFAAVVIAFLLCCLAAMSSGRARTALDALAMENIPQIAAGSEIERSLMMTLFAARGYEYTDEALFLESARRALKESDRRLKEAGELSARHNIPLLRQKTEMSTVGLKEYEQLLEVSEKLSEKSVAAEHAVDQGFERYMKAAHACLDGINKRLEQQVAKPGEGGAGSGDAVALLRAAGLANDVIELGNSVRAGYWKARASRDWKLMQEGARQFGDVARKLDQLSSAGINDAEKVFLEECRGAAREYQGSIDAYLMVRREREELNLRRSQIADGVLAASREICQAGMQDAGEASMRASATLSSATMAMFIMLLIGTASGLALGIFIGRGGSKSRIDMMR